MGERKRIGVVLFQLGGPDSPEAVEPFLYNLFCDPEILDLPLGPLFRKPLAWWISRRRARKVASAYAQIGGGSPIRRLTERQAGALERALAEQADARVVVAMRYWHPDTVEAIQALNGHPFDELVLLPLYPQFSLTTTGSSHNEWSRQFGSRFRADGIPVRMIERYYDHPLYLDALIDKMNRSLEHFRRGDAGDGVDDVHFVFSAHNLPMSFVERGDPYPREIEATVELLRQRGGWPNPFTICYQSKVGRQRWLQPTLHDTIERIGRAGTRRVLVVPISFVSEHIETLYEINKETRQEATAHGIEQFAMMPALNDSPLFISALADLVLRAVDGRQARTAPAGRA